MEPVIHKQDNRRASKKYRKMPYRLNTDNNLEWDMVIPGGETNILHIKYSVEHPKNKGIEFKEK